MKSHTISLYILALVFISSAGMSIASGAEPVNPNLDKNARVVFDYLHSIYGKRVLAGMNGDGESQETFEISGKKPAIKNYDLCGWNSPTWGASYTRNVEKTIERAKACWQEGAIVTITFHWNHPLMITLDELPNWRELIRASANQ